MTMQDSFEPPCYLKLWK